MDQTAATITNSLYNILCEFKLKPSNIISFVSDNCNTMKSVCTALCNKISDQHTTFNFFGCFAHIINIIIKDSVLNSEIFIKARKLAFTIKDSPKIISLLQAVASEQQPYKTIKCDVVTRWNSSYIMIDSIINNKNILMKVTDTNVLQDNEWAELNIIKTLLKPFFDLTKIVSGSKYPTIGFSYSVILKINECLDELAKCDIFKARSKVMIDKFNKYFEFINNEYYIGMVLDPRFKTQLLSTKQTKDTKKIINNIYDKYSKLHKEKKNNVQDSSKVIDIFPVKIINNEVNTYISTPIVSKDTDILEWWKNNKENFKILSLIAMDYLTIPISSVSVEELFSKAGDVVTDQRNRLDPNIIKKILCLENWIDLK